MKLKLYLLLFLLLTASSTFSNYFTPGTGIKWNLDDLVTNSGGRVTFSSGVYNVNDTVSVRATDTIYITTNATVKFAANTYFDVTGSLIINPPTGVTFTAQDINTRYLGLRINATNATVLRKLTFEYANSLRLFNCNIPIDSSIFRLNTPVTTFGNSAISLNTASPVITNCQFLNNQRAAIQGGANVNNAPKIINCLFQGNNTLDQNVPQINLGATSSGEDTVKILNNQILRSSTNSGGIGFLPIGNVYAIIKGNTIKNNRYGLTFNGGSNINAIVSYNQIDSNNIQGDPNLGGSGIAFSGGTSTSHQNVIVTGNLIRWNLWGVTIGATTTGGGSKPNLGNLTNSDTTDDGKNQFIGNTNAATPRIDLYNNNVDSIYAQNNYWGTDNPDTIEARIFHKPDNSSLGWVIYSNYIVLPIELTKFAATANNNSVLLTWQTSLESNSDYFEIERSYNGDSFYSIGKVAASNTMSAVRSYSFTDVDASGDKIYYRIKLVDKDNKFKYSEVLSVRLHGAANTWKVKLYPTVLKSEQSLTTEIQSDKPQKIAIQFLSAEGKRLTETSKVLVAGNNKFIVSPNPTLPAGLIYVRFVGEGFQQTIAIVKQ
jgi:hypothetical protein